MEYGLLLASATVSFVVQRTRWFRRPRPARVLVVKLDHLGDVVTATPVFRALRSAFPNAPIDALVGSDAHAILAGNPFLSNVLTYDAPRFRRPGQAAPSRRAAWRRIRELGAGRYTHIVELRGDAWTLVLPFLCGARTRVDRGTVRIRAWIGRNWLRLPHAEIPTHEVETNLTVVRPLLGGTAGAPRVEIHVTDQERRAARDRLAAEGVDRSRPLVVVQPGASWRPRAWRAESFATLAGRLATRHGASIVFIGSREESDVAERLRALAPDLHHAYLFGARSLRETIALIAEAALVIGNDSGPVHLAAACGVPVVALFGPQLPERFRPWSPRAVVLHHRVDCCPCAQSVCVRPDDPCVNLISVDEAEAAALRLLAGGRA